ncbi:hypothetical protein FE257_012418 [Aspergillus nanangensis]|uniref:Zn(2)-C6 fungal-type domain-containing protein n=1 Tax=Aspergillus nanangensis TaxID=2582783 RepID=A0AAD4GXI6_ASPNN|nr:hypothetical protein FE257_012418 [Aspergillus nanangensis]
MSTSNMHASDDDERTHRQKRRRVSKACDRCRHGKLKCDGARPRCDTCLKADKPCSYGAGMRRRGLRTGYVRALECLWGLVLQSGDGSEDTIEKLIMTTAKQSFWVRDDIRDGLKAGETPWETWKASRIPQAIDALLSVQDSMEDDVSTTVSRLCVQTQDPIPVLTPAEVSSSLWRRLHGPSEVVCSRCSGEVHERTVELQGAAAAAAAASQTHMELEIPVHSIHTTQDTYTLPKLPPNPMQLLNRYFAVTHTWLPIVERHAVYRSFFAHHKGSASSSVLKQHSGDTAVLWAILAHATMMERISSREDGLASKPSTRPDELYMVARNAIPLEKEDSYSIGHVQAHLILGLLHYTACEWDIGRIMVGKAIVIGSRIGLDQPDQCQTEYHRRTWVGCFVLDTLISAHTGKTPLIQSSRVMILPPIDQTGNEEWEPWNLQDVLLPDAAADMAEYPAPTHTLTVFARFLDIICIVNDFICATTNQQRDACREALLSWNESLPEHIRSSWTASIPPPPNILNLYLVHAFLQPKLSRLTTECQAITGNSDMIPTMDTFCSRFDVQAIPPFFHLFRTSLSQPMPGTGSLRDLIAHLKKAPGRGLTHESQLDYNSISISNGDKGPPRESSCTSNPAANTATCRAEQQLDSMMDIHGSWPNATTDLFLEPQDAPENNPCSQLDPLVTITGCSDDLSSLDELLDEATLGYLKDWDDIEIHDRDQVRRNLGFTF